jgi:predicted Zn-dependent protease
MLRSRLPFVVGVLALVGCGSTNPAGNGTTPPGNGSDPAGNGAIDLPEIPTKIDATRIAPTDGNSSGHASPLLGIMKNELGRWTSALSAKTVPAYFIAYTITEQRMLVMEAEGGALVTDSDETQRTLDVEVRVGSKRFDNRRMLANDRLRAYSLMPRRGRVPFGQDAQAIQSALWLETDRRYREAVINLRNLKTQQNLSSDKVKADDFSPEEAESFAEREVTVTVDKDAWRKRIRACSKRARKGVATRAGCRLDVAVITTYYVNSEGSTVQTSNPTSRFSVSVGIKADDGMSLSRTDDRFVRTPDALPKSAEVDRMIKTVTDELDALHKAPVVDPYAGPAILEGRAAAVFFHEVFGHRIEGHRQKDPNFGKTFTNAVGTKIMPEWLTVYDDPTIEKLNGERLNGFYRFDDEGVRAQRAPLVDKGVLKGFVLGRTPLPGFAKSNGHGRRDAGLPPVSRQGNLVVESSRSVTDGELRKLLIEELKRENKPYGMIFTDISGGYTNTSQFSGQHFKVLPTMAYRIYPDGRTELVRGVDIVGTPLTVLASIAAASRPIRIFNGMCGAESGWVPVSASAPSLFLRNIEVERSFKGANLPPVLNPPSVRR